MTSKVVESKTAKTKKVANGGVDPQLAITQILEETKRASQPQTHFYTLQSQNQDQFSFMERRGKQPEEEKLHR